MMTAQDIRLFCEARALGEVAAVGIEGTFPLVLDGANGRRYREVVSNVWMDDSGEEADVAYVGTSRHAGFVVLRPLFVFYDEKWRNSLTGAQAGIAIPACAAE